jgi:alginate O-acetyltransferase complex protein AlgJ
MAEGIVPERPLREQVALRELGRTDVSPSTARLLVFAFLATIALVPVTQQVHEAVTTRALPQAFDVFRAVPTERSLHEFEASLEDRSLVGQWLLPRVQRALLALGAGNEEAYLGRDGWLFYRPGVDHVTGPGYLEPRVLARRALGGEAWERPPEPDPVAAIVHWRDQLAARGIALIVVPTPVKPQLRPEQFVPGRYPVPLANPSDAELRERLAAASVHVFDPAPAMLTDRGDDPLYLPTDTHWTPAAMARTCAALAREIERAAILPERPRAAHVTVDTNVEARGDIAAMLKLRDQDQPFPLERVTIRRVLEPDGSPWRADPTADVLLLGDSFSNVYSLEAMGFGASAGFVEHLSRELGRPLDRIVINAGGALSTRQALRDDLARGVDRLAGKRLVVWQFAARELAVGDWRRIELPRTPAPAPIQAEGSFRARGTIVVRATPPRPGTVPYRDCLIAVRLRDLSPTDATAAPTEALVYVFGMRDDVWTEAAGWLPGSAVELDLTPWAQAREQHGGLNRRELDDDDALRLPAFFGVDPRK